VSMSADEIKDRLTNLFNPFYIEVHDDSRRHRGHAGYQGDTGTHFSVLIVSSDFDGVSLLERHRRVYEMLKTAMAEGMHALVLNLHTPVEWALKQKRAPEAE